MNLGLGLFLQAIVRSGIFMGTILTGSGAPASGTGSDGDYYYDTANPLNFYGPKAAGAWPAVVNLFGGTVTFNDATAAAMSIVPSHNGINRINGVTGSDLAIGINSNDAIHISATAVAFGEPLSGNGTPMSFKPVALAFSGSDITLNATQQGSPILQCSGTTGNIIGTTSGYYIVDNTASASARTMKTSTSTGVTIAASKTTTVYYSATAADFKIICVGP